MSLSIYSLELSADQLRMTEEAVRKLAFQLWEEAGSPSGDGANFWSEAEAKWIGLCYVPPRADSNYLSQPIGGAPNEPTVPVSSPGHKATATEKGFRAKAKR